jgi:predicted acyltransferase
VGIIFPHQQIVVDEQLSFYILQASLCNFLAACHWLIDIHRIKTWSKPFTWYGMNAIFVFVASALLVKTLSRIKVGAGDRMKFPFGVISIKLALKVGSLQLMLRCYLR